jgi:hypothetical protein
LITSHTVRSSAKGDYLTNLFKSDKFSYAIVEDIEKDDAFNEVVKSGNFDVIEHTASPFHVCATNTFFQTKNVFNLRVRDPS